MGYTTLCPTGRGRDDLPDACRSGSLSHRHKIPLERVDWPIFALLGMSLLAAGTVWQWEAYGAGVLQLVIVPILLWAAVRVWCVHRRRWQPSPGRSSWAGCWPRCGAWRGGRAAMAWRWMGSCGWSVPTILTQPHGPLSGAHPVPGGRGGDGCGRGPALVAHGRHRHRVGRAAADRQPRGAAPGAAGRRADLRLAGPAAATGVEPLAAAHKGGVRWGIAAGPALVLCRWGSLLALGTAAQRRERPGAPGHLGGNPAPLARPSAGWRRTGSFYWTYPAYLPPGAPEPNQLHPHNIWLELAATWGILGFVWVGALLLTWRSRLRAPQ